GGRRAIEGQKIRPGFMQLEAEMMRRDDLDRLDLFFQVGCPGALVALEAVFDILGGEGVAVMKLHPLSQLKVIYQAVRALTPLRGEAGGHGIVGHGFHQGIVHGVQKHIRRDDARGLGRIKPGGRNVHMDCPRHLTAGLALLRQCRPEMWPPLMPGEHTSSATHGAEESTSGERRELLHGIVDQTSPLLRDAARGPLSVFERSLPPASRYSACSNSNRHLAAIVGALRILTVRLRIGERTYHKYAVGARRVPGLESSRG